MDAKLAEQVWKRLRAGKPLTGLGLGTVDGRADLRGLRAPEMSAARSYNIGRVDATELANVVALRGVTWSKLDFSGAELRGLRFFDCEIADCRFDGARCRDWRAWGTRVANTTFVSADLRDASLGGVDEGKRNSFRRVDFRNADLRKSAHCSADMVECQFANVSGVDFQGDVFVNCTFEGEVDDVMFDRQAFRARGCPANEMKGVDFRNASLRHVGFRGLDLLDVKWPVSAEHVVLDDYPATLERILSAVRGRTDERARQIAFLCTNWRKWVGPNQKQGLINKKDLAQIGGQEFVDEFLRLARPN